MTFSAHIAAQSLSKSIFYLKSIASVDGSEYSLRMIRKIQRQSLAVGKLADLLITRKSGPANTSSTAGKRPEGATQLVTPVRSPSVSAKATDGNERKVLTTPPTRTSSVSQRSPISRTRAYSDRDANQMRRTSEWIVANLRSVDPQGIGAVDPPKGNQPGIVER